MRNQKVKIKKARKIGVVGTIVWLIIFSFAFTIAITVILSLCIAGVVDGKREKTGNIIRRDIAEFTFLTEEKGMTGEEAFETIGNLDENFLALSVLGTDGEVKDEYGGEAFNSTGKHEIPFLSELASFEQKSKVYISDEELAGMDFIGMQGFEFEGSLRIAANMVRNFFDILESNEGDTLNWMAVEIESCNVYYVTEPGTEEARYAIKYHVGIAAGEIFFAIGACAAISIMYLLVLIYQIVSIIRMSVNRHRVYNLAYSDTITSGKNKLYFDNLASKLIRKKFKKINGVFSSSKESITFYAIVHLRFDRFRNYVICNGIEKGDEVLEKIYKLLSKQINKKEIAVRYEKSDYALLLLYDKEENLASRLMTIMGSLAGADPMQKLSFVCGICPVLHGKDNPESLYNNAGIARSQIHEDSALPYAWFTNTLEESQIWERRVENEMERALINKEFVMYLQPKYKAKDEVLGGAEALCRWQHPTDGLIPPYKFIPLFEKNGFIIKLDDYMLNEVARYQAKWISEGRNIVPISVNVSRAHFTRPDLAEHIRDIVDSYGVPHNVIELELTESAFFDDKDILINTVKKMQEYGFPVSMDDFGAGYSSLNSLKELPLDVVKLDAEFFRGDDGGDRGKMIVGDTIALAKRLGMHIVAEGIETREQVDFLANLNCDLIQGYYFAKPMSVYDYEQSVYPQDFPTLTGENANSSDTEKA